MSGEMFVQRSQNLRGFTFPLEHALHKDFNGLGCPALRTQLFRRDSSMTVSSVDHSEIERSGIEYVNVLSSLVGIEPKSASLLLGPDGSLAGGLGERRSMDFVLTESITFEHSTLFNPLGGPKPYPISMGSTIVIDCLDELLPGCIWSKVGGKTQIVFVLRVLVLFIGLWLLTNRPFVARAIFNLDVS